MNLYLALVQDKEIWRMEFEWMPQIEALMFIQSVIAENLGPTWQGTVIVDKEPIFAGEDNFMFIGEAFSRPDGTIGITPREVNWTHRREHDPD